MFYKESPRALSYSRLRSQPSLRRRPCSTKSPRERSVTHVFPRIPVSVGIHVLQRVPASAQLPSSSLASQSPKAFMFYKESPRALSYSRLRSHPRIRRHSCSTKSPRKRSVTHVFARIPVSEGVHVVQRFQVSFPAVGPASAVECLGVADEIWALHIVEQVEIVHQRVMHQTMGALYEHGPCFEGVWVNHCLRLFLAPVAGKTQLHNNSTLSTTTESGAYTRQPTARTYNLYGHPVVQLVRRQHHRETRT